MIVRIGINPDVSDHLASMLLSFLAPFSHIGHDRGKREPNELQRAEFTTFLFNATICHHSPPIRSRRRLRRRLVIDWAASRRRRRAGVGVGPWMIAAFPEKIGGG